MWAATGAKPALGQVEVLRVGVAGSEPFVVKEPAGLAGVAVEIWEGLAAKAGWRYQLRPLKEVESLPDAFGLLKRRAVDAVVFDRPQLLYFLKEQHDDSVAVSKAEYMRQAYAFAMPMNSPLLHPMNVNLLLLEESGRDRIVTAWLGEEQE